MKTIKNFLLICLAIISLVAGVAGYHYKAWHLFVIAISAGLLFKSIYIQNVNKKNHKKKALDNYTSADNENIKKVVIDTFSKILQDSQSHIV